MSVRFKVGDKVRLIGFYDVIDGVLVKADMEDSFKASIKNRKVYTISKVLDDDYRANPLQLRYNLIPGDLSVRDQEIETTRSRLLIKKVL